MSRTGEYFLEVQEQERRDWICAQLNDDEADEDTPGWSELAQDWYYQNHHMEEEYEWYESHSYNEIHQVFTNQIEKLKDLLSIQVAIHHEETFFKMAYAHAVTLMESFLADTVRSLIISDEKYFINAIKNVDELKDSKFTLEEYVKNPDGAKGFTIQILAKVMYHNIKKVKKILEAVLGGKLNLDISDVSRITYFRHDIVHRDGKSVDGNLIKVDKEIALEVISSVETFVESVAKQVEDFKNV